MALNKQELIDEALAIIPREECVTLEEVWLFMGITRTTAFNYQLNVVDEIKEAVLQEKIKVKKKLRRKWRDSDNATLQIAEFKLIGTDEEVDRLNTQRINQNLTVNKPGISLTFGAEQDDNG